MASNSKFLPSFSSPSPSPSPSSNPISGIPTLSDFEKLLKMGGLGGAIAACGVLFSLLALVFAGLRMIVRQSSKTLGWDDYLMLLASFLYFIDNAMAIVATLYGIGVKDFKVDLTHPLLGTKWVVIWGFVYAISTIPVKISLCLSILRVKKSAFMRSAAYFLIALTVAAAVLQIVWIVLSCSPFSYLWDQATQQGTCVRVGTTIISIYLFAGVCAFVDWIVTIIVGFAIWRTDLPWTQKLFSWGVFSFGIFASIATAVRIFFVYSYAGLGYKSSDFYYSLGGITLASQFEIGLLILGSCAPSALQGIELINWHFWNKVNGTWHLLKPKKADTNEDTGKALGNETIITGGVTAADKKQRKRKSKQRKKKACAECGKRGCKDHSDIIDLDNIDPATIDPNNVPKGYILVTQTVEVTSEPADGYAVPDSAVTPFSDNRNSIAITTGADPISRASSRANPVSRASSSRGPRYRQLNLPSENIYAMDTLTPDGRLASSGNDSAMEGSTRVNSITSENTSSNGGRAQGFRDV